ncbi:MAG: protein kinase [Polyangiales bacterium]
MKRCPRCNGRYDEEISTCPSDGALLVDVVDPLVGRTLAGRYKLLKRIGVGGMGSVYRARHLLLRRDVAVKLLASELTRDPVMRQRFIREAQAANLLKHPNIVDVFDVAEEGVRVFLVMELLEGESLAARVQQGALPVREAIEMVAPVAAALERAHAREIVHRDIKPENVFVCVAPDGRREVKVVDFGIAHIKFEARLTGPNEALGTPEYLAPELARGEPCTPATDLYSLGVMLFELVTGALPFNGTVTQLVLQHRDVPPPRARSLNPAVPAELDALIDRLLSKTPGERAADAGALRYELLALLGDSSGTRPRPAVEPHDDGADERPTRPYPEDLPPSLATLREQRKTFEVALAAAWRDQAPPSLRGDFDALSAAIARLEAVEHERRVALNALVEHERRAQSRREHLLHARSAAEAEAERLDARARSLEEAARAALADEVRARNEVSLAWHDLGPPADNPAPPPTRRWSAW